MWLHRLIGIALLAAALSACGFEPLYGQGKGKKHSEHAIEVMPILEHEGQVLRAALRRSFIFKGPTTHRLEVKLSEKMNVVAIDSAGDVTRQRMTITASWHLFRLAAEDKEKPLRGAVSVFETFNVFASDFSNLTAERAARERSTRRLANMISVEVTAKLGGT